MHRISVNVAEYLKRTVPDSNAQTRIEVRFYATLITIGFEVLVLEPLFYLWSVPDTKLEQISRLAPSVMCIQGAFLIALLLPLPHLFSLLFMPDRLGTRWPRRLAAYGTVLAAITWFYLGVLAIPLDVGSLEWAYFLRTIGAVVVGMAFGFSVNASQGRALRNAFDKSTGIGVHQ